MIRSQRFIEAGYKRPRFITSLLEPLKLSALGSYEPALRSASQKLLTSTASCCRTAAQRGRGALGHLGNCAAGQRGIKRPFSQQSVDITGSLMRRHSDCVFLHLMSDFLTVFWFGDFILEWRAGSRSWQGHTRSQYLSVVVLCLFVIQRRS